mmetsp:Transcript_4575/g.6872  ORF Transcript_4575/g.6872 Transcript_4575/m.6872 type:complete len:95 (-) Transcript_4575:38-322(-)
MVVSFSSLLVVVEKKEDAMLFLTICDIFRSPSLPDIRVIDDDNKGVAEEEEDAMNLDDKGRKRRRLLLEAAVQPANAAHCITRREDNDDIYFKT